jgi:membrane fusion protein (multidrug efflux system)
VPVFYHRARYGPRLFFLFSILLAGCAHGDDSKEAVQAPPPLVVVAPVRQSTVPITNDYQGTTGAIASVDVRARVQGVLEAAHFKEGSLVHQGQLLFTLQKNQYQAALKSALGQLLSAHASLTQAENSVQVAQAQAVLAQRQADLDRANTTVNRTRPLAADKALPQKDLDNALSTQAAAQANVDAAKAQLEDAKVNQVASISSGKAAVLSGEAAVENARINLGYTDINAPVTGLIGFLKYDVGNVVGDTPTTQVIDTITTVDPIKVDFAVDEPTYLALSGLKHDAATQALRDQDLRLVLTDNSVYPHPGTLYAVNPTLDAKTGTIAVEARYPNPDGILRPGGFARVRVTVGVARDALLVPQTAIGQTQGVTTVYTVDANDVAALHTVSLGQQIGQDVIVLSGLHAGDRVVVEGAAKVQPGAKVALQAAAAH